MTQASVRASLAKEEAASLISDEEENNKILSVKSMPVTRVISGNTSGQNVKSKVTEKSKNSKAKSAMMCPCNQANVSVVTWACRKTGLSPPVFLY